MFWRKPKLKKRKRKKNLLPTIVMTNMERAFGRIEKLEIAVAELASRKQNTGWKQDHEPVDNDKVLEIEDRLKALIVIVDNLRKEKRPEGGTANAKD